ncbi:MAG: pyridoxamine 5'-phosphate oxidase family protein [Acidimicrobiia bacterium]
MEWSDVEAAARRIHWGAFLATANREGTPHLAFVSPGFAHQRIWVVSDRDTRKVRNVSENPAVAMHWPVDPDDTNLQLLVEGRARLVTDETDKASLWALEPVPWRLADFYDGPADPKLVFIEIQPRHASLAQAFGEDFETWSSRDDAT